MSSDSPRLVTPAPYRSIVSSCDNIVENFGNRTAVPPLTSDRRAARYLAIKGTSLPICSPTVRPSRSTC